ncbi:MAG TPA: type II toxin-antitoxin system RelE/ParE family toxin [candidate division Zixibacteria bacterium]|nr:type II toxin-antitoxin system RelE/ParE family toxin [candidate division Zixibacteria bacterium]
MYVLSEFADKDIENFLKQSIMDFGLEQTEACFTSLKDCHIKPGYRRFVYQSHVIFYRNHEQDIFVVRILHKAMDIEKQFD